MGPPSPRVYVTHRHTPDMMGLDPTATGHCVYMSTHMQGKAEKKQGSETDKRFQSYSVHILICISC